MFFSDLQFITVFLPIFLILYLVSLKLFRKSAAVANVVLILGSFVFYYLGAGLYTLVLVALTVITWLLTLGIDYYKHHRHNHYMKTVLLVILIGINTGVLASYKLFFDGMLIGVGFFTLSLISYGADVYMGYATADKNLINVLTFSSMFTKLLQGPFARYRVLKASIIKRHVSFSRFDRGLKLFVFGLSMKVLLADKLGCLWNELTVIGYDSISTPLAYLGMIGYSLQIYFDFRGYSLMAMGLGDMLGLHLPINFNEPYSATTISEFYRRWHISLGNWFKDYIYIPLGGNRAGLVRGCINIGIVWLATSLWHGFRLNYLIWGIGLGLLIIIEKLFAGKFFTKYSLLGHLYVLIAIPFSWIPFAITDMRKLGMYFGRLFPFGSQVSEYVHKEDYLRMLGQYWPFFLAAFILCIPFISRFIITSRRKWWSGIIVVGLFVLCIYQIALGEGNPFMYLNF